MKIFSSRFHHRVVVRIIVCSFIGILSVAVTAGAANDNTDNNDNNNLQPVPACSVDGAFQCLSNGDTAGPVTDIDSCEDACRICEGKTYFCPDFQVTEQEFTMAPSVLAEEDDDDLTFFWNQTNSTSSLVNSTTTNETMLLINNDDDDDTISLSTSRAANTTTTTNKTKPEYSFNASSTPRTTKESFQCQCFPVFTDTTSCGRTRVRKLICEDPDYGAPGSYIPEDSGVVGRRGGASSLFGMMGHSLIVVALLWPLTGRM